MRKRHAIIIGAGGNVTLHPAVALQLVNNSTVTVALERYKNFSRR